MFIFYGYPIIASCRNRNCCSSWLEAYKIHHKITCNHFTHFSHYCHITFFPNG